MKFESAEDSIKTPVFSSESISDMSSSAAGDLTPFVSKTFCKALTANQEEIESKSPINKENHENVPKLLGKRTKIAVEPQVAKKQKLEPLV